MCIPFDPVGLAPRAGTSRIPVTGRGAWAPRGSWNERMLVETFFSMLTTVCHCKKMLHRVWRYFTMRLAFTVAAFTVLVQWDGLPLDEHGCAHRSIAQFSL